MTILKAIEFDFTNWTNSAKSKSNKIDVKYSGFDSAIVIETGKC